MTFCSFFEGIKFTLTITIFPGSDLFIATIYARDFNKDEDNIDNIDILTLNSIFFDVSNFTIFSIRC